MFHVRLAIAKSLLEGKNADIHTFCFQLLSESFPRVIIPIILPSLIPIVLFQSLIPQTQIPSGKLT